MASKSRDSEYLNVSVFIPLSGSTYIELRRRLRNTVKDLINIKNNDNKCFLWCHIRHLNPLKIHPEKITKEDKNVNNVYYDGIEFTVSKKDFGRVEKKDNICIKVFCYKNNLIYPVYVLNEKLEGCMDLLMTTDGNKPHYFYIKDLYATR